MKSCYIYVRSQRVGPRLGPGLSCPENRTTARWGPAWGGDKGLDIEVRQVRARIHRPRWLCGLGLRAGCLPFAPPFPLVPIHPTRPHSPHSLSCWGWLWGSCLGRWKKGKWSLYSSSSCPTGSSQAAGSFCPRSQVLLSCLLRTGLLLPGCGNRSAPTLGAQGGYGPRTHYNCRGHVTP